MRQTQINVGSVRVKLFHADVPFFRMPKVKLVGEFYEDAEGKKYVPELFDKFFKAVKTKIKTKNHKGELIGNNYI